MGTLNSNDVDAELRSHYEDRIAACQRQVEVWKQQRLWISRGRGASFLLAVLFVYFGIAGTIPAILSYGLGGIVFIGFVLLVARDETLQEASYVANLRREISSTQLARMDRQWDQIPAVKIDVPASAQSISLDLDLFGHASLYQFVCRAHTPRGRQLLRDWLIAAASPDEIRQRHEAVAYLAAERAYREELDLRGRVLSSSEAGPTAFVTWAESDDWLTRRRWLLWTVRILAAAFLVGAVSGFAQQVQADTAFIFCAAVAAANMLVSVLMTGRVHETFDQVDSRHHDIAHYRSLLQLFDSLPADGKLLGRLRSRMGTTVSAPRKALRKLARIMKVAQMRHSPLWGVIHIVIQITTLLDFHVLAVLERWQRRHGSEVRTWFEAIGELEALASLASLVHDFPNWQFPTIDEQGDSLQAEGLGHPLLANCVCNDVRIGPRGTFLLVTGSNMSGKSTLLRAVGVNAALAQAGGPVFASKCSLPPLAVETSMRIQDSLEDGISSFMAELRRLKEIVDRASETKTGGRVLLFLLDEILQGTNSVERHIAVARVVKHLTDCQAIGAISTHDLELAKSPELKQTCQTVHFRETIPPDGAMTFDYQMHRGLATSTNALKLLELVGIADR